MSIVPPEYDFIVYSGDAGSAVGIAGTVPPRLGPVLAAQVVPIGAQLQHWIPAARSQKYNLV